MQRRTSTYKLLCLSAIISMLLGFAPPVLAAPAPATRTEEVAPAAKHGHSDYDSAASPWLAQARAAREGALTSSTTPRAGIEAPQPASPSGGLPLSPRRRAGSGSLSMTQPPALAASLATSQAPVPNPPAGDDTRIAPETPHDLPRPAPRQQAGNNWAVGNTVYLCAGTDIRYGPGFAFDVHTTVPVDDWAVVVIDGPRNLDGQVWWDIDRAAAGDPSGGTGWVYQGQADSCSGSDIEWRVGEIVGLCQGTEIRHGPGLAVHTVVPEDDWLVKIIDGPRDFDGHTWWDTSRREAGDPSGGTGWVSQQQAEDSCRNGGGEPGPIGPLPLTPELRALLRALGYLEYVDYAGDPVNVATGRLTHQVTDLNVPGLAGFDFVLQRTYNSRDEREGVFGFGWSSLLDMSLRIANDGSMDVRYPDGHGAYFVAEGDGYVPGQGGVFDTLTYDGSGFTLTTREQIAYLFDEQGRLLELRDRHGNSIRLERDGSGHVNRIVDSAGRAFDLTYEGEHVASLADPLGRTIGYAYAGGDLTGVTDGNGGVHRLGYDAHRLTQLTDPEDILYLQNLYDGEGRVIEQIDAAGSHSYFSYAAEGETLFTDNLGRPTRYRYDDLSRVTAVQDAQGHTEQYAYDDDDNLTAYTDKRGNTWRYTYDERGNLLSEDGPLNWHVAYTYNETNDLTSTTGALERTTRRTWENGNLVRVERPGGTAFTYTYDGHGQRLTQTDPNGHTTHFAYDGQGNLSEMRSPMDCVTRYEYDGAGRVLSMTDGNSHTARFTYDGNDNVVLITDPRLHTTRFTYDGNDSLVEMVDRRGGVWTYEYDENLKLVAETDPMQHTTRHAYDLMYNRTSTTDAREHATILRYDELYRLKEVEDARGGLTRYAYDANGNLTRVTDALNQETRFEHDELNRLTLVQDALSGETHYQYDAAGRLIGVVNPRQAPTGYTYDPVDRLVRVTDALDGVTEYAYDDGDNLRAVTDANRHTTHFTYDASDRLVEQRDPEGHRTGYEYDCTGNLTRVVDGRNHAARYAYDENDNLIRIVDALGGETSYTYDEEDARASATDPNGHTTGFVYDRDGLLRELHEAGGQATRFEYDGTHNLAALTDARDQTTAFEFDELNRLTAETDPLEHATRYTYDALGRRVAIADANQVITGYAYDALNRLAAVMQNYQPELPADYQTNVRTAYTYDPAGNLRTIADANGHVTSFEYDLLDRLTSEVNPLEKAWQYEYDPAGNLARRTDANGAVTHYTYTADDLLAGIGYPDGSRVSFAYDAAHNQVEMTDRLGKTANVYDELNRPVSSTNHLDQAVGYAYDPASNRTGLTYLDGRTLRYEWDANNRVSRVIDPDGGAFVAEYDPTHNLTALYYPNQTHALMDYDAAGRLVSLVNRQTGGDVISSFAYTLDAAGNRLHVDEYYRWRQPRAMSQDYTYDPLYRLVRSQDSEGRFTQYGYDAAGNRLNLASNYDPLRTPTGVTPYTVASTYNAANQLATAEHSVFGLTTYAYDANGNRTGREGPDTSTGNKKDALRTDYAYDYENRLIQASDSRDPGNGKWQARGEISMLYDGYGRLFRRSQHASFDVTGQVYRLYLPGVSRGPDEDYDDGGDKWLGFVYDGLDPIAEYGEPNPNHYANYYRGLGRILEMHEFKSQQSAPGTAYYFHHDGLGSVSALTKHDGQSAHTYRYADYGLVLDKNDGAADASNFTDPHNHYTYTGQEWEEGTRLYHFYAREYDPGVGVWLQADPYRGRLVEPGTAHRYGYVSNNPINRIDVYGLAFNSAQAWVLWDVLGPSMSQTGDISGYLAIGSLAVGIGLAPFTAGGSFAVGLAAFEAFGTSAAVLKTGAALHADAQYVMGRIDKQQWIDTQINTGLSLGTARISELVFPHRVPGRYPFRNLGTIWGGAHGAQAIKQIVLQAGGNLLGYLYDFQQSRTASTTSSFVTDAVLDLSQQSSPTARKPMLELDWDSPEAIPSAKLRPQKIVMPSEISISSEEHKSWIEFHVPSGHKAGSLQLHTSIPEAKVLALTSKPMETEAQDSYIIVKMGISHTLTRIITLNGTINRLNDPTRWWLTYEE